MTMTMTIGLDAHFTPWWDELDMEAHQLYNYQIFHHGKYFMALVRLLGKWTKQNTYI